MIKYILSIVMLLFASSAYAIDGGTCDDAEAVRDSAGCILLIDGASSTGFGNGGVGIPMPTNYNGQGFTISVSKATGCTLSSLQVQVSWSNTSNKTVLSHFNTLQESNSFAHYVQEGIIVGPYLFANVLDATGCTEIDVVVQFGPKRKNN